jgi:hypothetical protein
MPTNTISKAGSYTDPFELFATQHMRATRSITMDLEKISFNEKGIKVLPQGSIIFELPSGMGRAMPCTKLKAASLTTSPTLSVEKETLFNVDDDVCIAYDTAIVTLSGTWATNDTITVNGKIITVTSTDNSLAKVVNKVASQINGVVSGGDIFVFSEYKMNDFVVSKTGANGNITVTLQPTVMASVGKIVSISPGVLTLAANSSLKLPVSTKLTISVIPAMIRGITRRPFNFEFKETNGHSPQSNDVAVYEMCAPYRKRLPFWNSQVQSALPMVVLY